ncbi:MAG: 16S rRNA (cytosine(967)-C(5))-methyltransferase RsmB, partial [Eubacterium sp.]
KVLARNDYKEEDKGLYLNIVYGTLQNRIYLDYLLSRYIEKTFDKLDPEVLEILRTAVYQIYFLDKIPEYAVVNEAVTMIGKMQPRAKGFVNGVLRNILRNKEKDSIFKIDDFDNEKEAFSVRYSIPLWIVYKYYETFGTQKTEDLLPMMNGKPPFTIRVNTLKISSEELNEKLTKKGIEVVPGKLDPDALNLQKIGAFGSQIHKDELFLKGFFMIQDQGAMLAARLLSPKSGDHVLDMCAAPGGKTTHLAQLMENKGSIIARDVFNSRLELIQNTSERMGIDIIHTEEKDGCIFESEEAEKYDKILLDAPCSGLGIIRRKPEIRYGMTKKDRKALTKLQEKLLDNAVLALKPGGSLVYCTCTVNCDENEKQIEKVLKKYSNVTLDPYGMRYTSPFEDDTDCFFMCKLNKQ